MENNEKELKEETPPAGDVQPVEGAKGEKEETPEETPEEKLTRLEAENATFKEENEQLTSDNKNYKEGIVSAQAKNTQLGEEVEETEPEAPVTPPVEPETPPEEDVNTAVKKELDQRDSKNAKVNERIAIKKWIKDNPELQNDVLRQTVARNYINRNGKSVDGIALDLETAHKLYKIDNNIPLETKTQIKVKTPNVPSSPGNPGAGISSFSEGEQKVMEMMDVKPEGLNAFKEAVKKGEITVEDDVLRLLNL